MQAGLTGRWRRRALFMDGVDAERAAKVSTERRHALVVKALASIAAKRDPPIAAFSGAQCSKLIELPSGRPPGQSHSSQRNTNSKVGVGGDR